jgi:hypothetical protein
LPSRPKMAGEAFNAYHALGENSAGNSNNCDRLMRSRWAV